MKSEKNKVVFMGYSVGGAHTLRTLLDLNADIIGIVVPASAPPEKNVDVLRLAGDLPVLYSNKPDIAVMETVRSWGPDLVVVNSFPYLLPPGFLEIPARGCINLHGSYLPAYRGAHVLQWAIINGEKETGITLHHIDVGMDTGDIIGQVKIPVRYEDTALTLRERMYAAGDELLKSVWPMIEAGTAPRTPQDHASASVFHKRKEKDGLIDWRKSSLEIYNLVRALVRPWPGANCRYDGAQIHIFACEEVENPVSNQKIDLNAGEIISVSEKNAVVACGIGFIRILSASCESSEMVDFRKKFVEGTTLH